MDISIFSRGIKLGTTARFGPVEQVSPPAVATVMLRQGTGSVCKALVEKGAEVKTGEVIASATDAQASDVHSPLSGTVKEISEVIATDGSKCPAVVIESDGKDTPCDAEAISKPLAASAEEIVKCISGAGIVTGGRGGKGLATILGEALTPRGFVAPTGSALIKPVDNLVVRFCDEDPHLGTLATVADGIGDNVGELRLGIELMQHITGAANIHLVFDKKQSAPAIEKMADDEDWPVHNVDSGQYPFAAVPFVAKKVSGKEPPIAFKQVHESGTLVVDVTEVLAVARAVEGGVVTERVITVLGPSGPRMCSARIGTPIGEVVAAVGLEADYSKIVLGGPMGGSAVHTMDYPVTRDMSGITLIPGGDVAEFENEPCVSCGLCAMVCPARLVPGMLSRYCEFGEFEQAENAHLFNCTECGCCAYVCPAGRSMVQFMVHGKAELLAARREG